MEQPSPRWMAGTWHMLDRGKRNSLSKGTSRAESHCDSCGEMWQPGQSVGGGQDGQWLLCPPTPPCLSYSEVLPHRTPREPGCPKSWAGSCSGQGPSASGCLWISPCCPTPAIPVKTPPVSGLLRSVGRSPLLCPGRGGQGAQPALLCPAVPGVPEVPCPPSPTLPASAPSS